MITKKELQHLSKLAKLNLSEDELKNLASQLDSILEFVSQLNEVKTDKVKETNQTTGLKNIYRQDEVIPCEEEKELIQCSPNKIKDNSIIVPRIL